MGKLDALMKAHGANISDSFGTGTPADGLPPGLSLDHAQRVPARDQGVARSKNAVEIPIEKIQADPDQPREEFEPEAMERLGESMRTKGQLQPIRVRWDEGRQTYIIILGERRWRAASQAGLKTLSCVVHQGPVDPGELLALQLIENAVREDLKPIEQAKAYRRLQELYGWSGNQLAKELAVPQPAVVHALALLKLPDGVQTKVEAGELAPRTAYEISKLDDEAEQVRLAGQVMTEKLTGQQVAATVKAKKAGRDAPAASARKEYRRDDGVRVTVTGAADAEAVLAALRWAVRKAQDELKAAPRTTPGSAGEAA
jgi:ParB family transcriptional regulator, chromosome partitioning protein